MKRIIYILAVLGLAAFLPSCEKPQEPAGEQTQLKLDKSMLSFSSEGGVLTVGYTASGEASAVEAEYDADWISYVKDAGETLEVSVAANSTKEQRKAVVTLLYGKASAELEIVQSAASDFSVDISVTATTETTAEVKAVPSDDETGYIVMTSLKDDYLQYGSDQELADATVALIQQYASFYGYSVSEFLESSGMMKKGERSLRFTGMEPGTEYILYAFGIDGGDGSQISDVVISEFKTDDIDMNGMTFTIEPDVQGPEVSVKVTPSITDQSYVFTIISAEALATAESIEAYMKEMIQTQISYGAMDGLTAEETIAEISWTGENTFSTTLNANTAYVALACSVTPIGLINSEIASAVFTTGDVVPSDNTFTISTADVNVTSAGIKVVASNQDPYIILLDKASGWKDVAEEDYRSKILAEFDLSYATALTGTTETVIEELEENTEYIVLVGGYTAGAFTTDIAHATFTTMQDGDPTQLQFSISVDDITQTGATVNITGTPENALYYWNVGPASMTDDDIRADVEYMAQSYISIGYVEDLADFMQNFGSRGKDSYRYTDLEQRTDYIVYTFGVNKDGSYATDIVRSEPFRLSEEVLSDASITLSYDKYFNCDEVVALYPQFSSWSGEAEAVLPMEADLSGDVDKYYYTVYFGDLTDQDRYSDGLVIEELLKQGYSTPTQVFLCDFGVDMTILGVAFDAEGNPGKVFRQKFSLDADGASPADEFSPDMVPDASSKMSAGAGGRTAMKSAGRASDVSGFAYRSVMEKLENVSKTKKQQSALPDVAVRK